MKVFRDADSIRAAVTSVNDPELSALIAKRIEELSEYADDYDLAELVHIFVVEFGDTLADLNSAWC